jgi:hypothetical protein
VRLEDEGRRMTAKATRDRLGDTAPGFGEFRAFREPPRASTTLEVRWIHRGPVPEAMIAWLRPFADRIERRDDRYFVDPDLGVKVKDAVRFDLKVSRGSLGKLTIPGGGRGRLELWEKWSFPLHENAAASAEGPGWLGLDKSRRRRSFSVVDEVVVERPVDQAELPGCSVELTEVAIGRRLWWTLGLEAIGARESLERNLHATVARLFRAPSPDPKLLDLRHSMSYPKWLHKKRARSDATNREIVGTEIDSLRADSWRWPVAN